MAHIPHYGTPGYSPNPTPAPAPASPLTLALRKNLPAGPPPESPLLKAAAHPAHSPQDSPSLRSANGNPAASGNKIKVRPSESCSIHPTVRVHRGRRGGEDQPDHLLHD